MTDPIELCRYQYDALDRLATTTPLVQAMAKRFYSDGRLATQIHVGEQRAFFQIGGQHLATIRRIDRETHIVLVACDSQNSVLHAAIAKEQTAIAYAPYGHHQQSNVFPGLAGFNGEHPGPVTGHYLLGNGYRAYNPVLMRFNSPDIFSPFGKGGLNAYAYCIGDPVNLIDPTGHVFLPVRLKNPAKAFRKATARVWGRPLQSVPEKQAMQIIKKPDFVGEEVISVLVRPQAPDVKALIEAGKRKHKSGGFGTVRFRTASPDTVLQDWAAHATKYSGFSSGPMEEVSMIGVPDPDVLDANFYREFDKSVAQHLLGVRQRQGSNRLGQATVVSEIRKIGR